MSSSPPWNGDAGMSGLVAFGEAMLRLSPPENERLERADELSVHVAGAESNLAAAAARTGLEATWLSKLPDSPLGRRVVAGLHEVGVATEVVWTAEGRQPIYYVERGAAPRGTDVVYDREGSPLRTTTGDELPIDRVTEASVFATSGITPALSGTLAETTAQLLETAADHGMTTAFDVNYRSKLWSAEAARTTLEGLLPDVDVLFVGADDARDVLGIDGAPAAILDTLCERWNFEVAVLTRGSWGAMAGANGRTFERRAIATETVDPVGTGDAFAGAFLARYREDGNVEDALAFGTAGAALKRTVPGDLAVISRAEIERVLAADDEEIRR